MKAAGVRDDIAADGKLETILTALNTLSKDFGNRLDSLEQNKTSANA